MSEQILNNSIPIKLLEKTVLFSMKLSWKNGQKMPV